MRVPIHVVEARREKLAALIERYRYLPVGELCRHLGVSEATARRGPTLPEWSAPRTKSK